MELQFLSLRIRSCHHNNLLSGIFKPIALIFHVHQTNSQQINRLGCLQNSPNCHCKLSVLIKVITSALRNIMKLQTNFAINTFISMANLSHHLSVQVRPSNLRVVSAFSRSPKKNQIHEIFAMIS